MVDVLITGFAKSDMCRLQKLAKWLASGRAYTQVKSKDPIRFMRSPKKKPPNERQLKGQEAFELRDYEYALTLFRKASFLEPRNPVLYIALAKTYTQLGDFKMAIANYRKALNFAEELPTEARDEYMGLLDLQGYNLLLKKDYTRALPFFSEAVALSSLFPNVWMHRVLTYIGLGLWVKALKDCDQVIALNNKDPDVYIVRAKLKWKLGLKARGNADITLAFKLAPDHPEVIMFEKQVWQQAQEVYDAACRAMLERDHQQAFELITTSLQSNPADVKMLIMRASCHREMGNYRLAMQDVEEATSQFHSIQKEQASHTHATASVIEHPEILRQRNLILNDEAVAFMEQKNFRSGLDCLNKAIESEMQLAVSWDKIDPRFYVNRGDCYRALLKLHAALADYHKALDMDPNNKDVKLRLSMVHYVFGINLFNEAQYAKAEVEFTRCIDFNPHVAIYYMRRGDSLQYQEKAARAYLDYKKAGALDPQDKLIQEKLKQFNQVLRPPKPHPEKKSIGNKRWPGHLHVQPNVETALHHFEKSNQAVQGLYTSRLELVPYQRRIRDRNRRKMKK